MEPIIISNVINVSMRIESACMCILSSVPEVIKEASVPTQQPNKAYTACAATCTPYDHWPLIISAWYIVCHLVCSTVFSIRGLVSG